MSWRIGTKLGRTLYRDEVLVGMVDTPEIAATIVDAMNARDNELVPVPGMPEVSVPRVLLERGNVTVRRSEE